MEWRKRCCGCKSCSWAECSALPDLPMPLDHIQWPSGRFCPVVVDPHEETHLRQGFVVGSAEKDAELSRSAFATVHDVGLNRMRSSNFIIFYQLSYIILSFFFATFDSKFTLSMSPCLTIS